MSPRKFVFGGGPYDTVAFDRPAGGGRASVKKKKRLPPEAETITRKEECIMKKTIFLVLAAVMFAGCTTTDLTTNKVGWSNYVTVSVKDFETVGVISLESQEVFEAGPLGFEKSLKGSRIVWSDLMAEAIKLGADDVVNVRVETTDKNRRRIAFFDWLLGYTYTYQYRATGLAIKYTDAVERVESRVGSTLNIPSSGPEKEFVSSTGQSGDK
jgi:hypothetical protein